MHDWQETGLTIDTDPPFREKVCARCGAINWGGDESGECNPLPLVITGAVTVGKVYDRGIRQDGSVVDAVH